MLLIGIFYWFSLRDFFEIIISLGKNLNYLNSHSFFLNPLNKFDLFFYNLKTFSLFFLYFFIFVMLFFLVYLKNYYLLNKKCILKKIII